MTAADPIPTIRDAVEADLPAMLRIVNAAIVETTASWNYHPVTLEDRAAWLAAKREAGLPVLVAEVDGFVRGYAAYGPFRSFDGYANTVEHSVYIDAAARRRGLGEALLRALILRAEQARLHVMVGGIEAGNTASIALHAKLGFAEVGRLPEVGRKFGRWLDLVLMQRML